MTIDVVVAMVSDTWSDSVRRGFYSTADQTILSLLASDDIGKVLVADHPRGLLSQVKRRSRGDAPAPSSGRLRGVRPLTVRTSAPTEWDRMCSRYKWYDRQLALAAHMHGLQDPALVTFNLYHAAASGPWNGRKVFYAQDDESSIPRLLEWKGLANKAYATIDAANTDVIAVSASLLQRIAPERGGTVIPNGIDPALWTLTPRVSPARRTKPVVVYAGSIDDRLDLDAIVALSQAGCEIRLTGNVAGARLAESLGALAGVHLDGPCPRAEVASRLYSADVCLLAHRATSLTESMSPLKLFEYLASGNPVVATDLSGIRDVAANNPRLTLVPPGGDYVSAVVSAAASPPLSAAARRRAVDEMSWRRRHRTLIERLAS